MTLTMAAITLAAAIIATATTVTTADTAHDAAGADQPSPSQPCPTPAHRCRGPPPEQTIGRRRATRHAGPAGIDPVHPDPSQPLQTPPAVRPNPRNA